MEQLRLVVDRGVHRSESFDEILGAMHGVVSLKRNEAKELFEIPLEKFRTVGRDPEGLPVLGRAARWEGFERAWRVLVTYRRAEAIDEAAKWEKAKQRVLPKVARWRRGRPNGKPKVAMSKLVDRIPREYRGVFDCGVEEVFGKDPPGTEKRRYLPRCAVDAKAEAELKASFGKAAIITDVEAGELSDEELLAASVGRHRGRVQVAEGPLRDLDHAGGGRARGGAARPCLAVRPGSDAVALPAVGGTGPPAVGEGAGGAAGEDPGGSGEPEGSARRGAGGDGGRPGGAGLAVSPARRDAGPDVRISGGPRRARLGLRGVREKIDQPWRSQATPTGRRQGPWSPGSRVTVTLRDRAIARNP
jgi:hypothetical protein